MAIDIVVPHLGDSVLEATIIKWVKHEGEFVKIGETILELETEKANFEVAAETSGVLKSIGRGENEDVEVGDVLGSIDTSSKPAKNSEKKQATTKSKTETKTVAKDLSDEVRATPIARNIAKQSNVDLAEVKPTGLENKITKESIEIIFEQIMSGKALTVEEAIQKASLSTFTEEELEKICDIIIEKNLHLIDSQETRSIGPLMGIVMKQTRGKASGEKVNLLLQKKIEEHLNKNLRK